MWVLFVFWVLEVFRIKLWTMDWHSVNLIIHHHLIIHVRFTCFRELIFSFFIEVILVVLRSNESFIDNFISKVLKIEILASLFNLLELLSHLEKFNLSEIFIRQNSIFHFLFSPTLMFSQQSDSINFSRYLLLSILKSVFQTNSFHFTSIFSL